MQETQSHTKNQSREEMPVV